MERNIPNGLRFAILHRAFRRALDECVRDYNLTGAQFTVLGSLGKLEHEGCELIMQKDLESLTHISHATMTELLKKLEKKGFITCTVSSSDRRCKVLSSTEQCKAVHNKIEHYESEIYKTLCTGLCSSDVKALERITDVMLKNAAELEEDSIFPFRLCAPISQIRSETHD